MKGEKSKMKKILIVMSSLYNGGAERSLVNMLNELPLEKYKIDLLLLKRKGMFLSQLPRDINVLKTPQDIEKLYGPISKAGTLAPLKIIANAVCAIISRNVSRRRGARWNLFYRNLIVPIKTEYDIAIAYISEDVLYIVNEKVNAQRKMVWIHNDYRSAHDSQKYDYRHLGKMDAIISISEACVEIMKSEFPDYAHKTFLLENITSSAVVKSRAEQEIPEEFATNKIKILSIGRLHDQKGFDIAIDAAKILKSKGHDFLWLIIGSGPLEKKLKAMIKQYNLEECIKLIGIRENPYCYIKNCDIFVQSSRYEGKSVVLDEAKIIGVPIIATQYPTVADQLIAGKEGMVVPLNPVGLANGIEHLIECEEDRDSYRRNLLEKDYGNQGIIDHYIEIIDG